METRVESRPGTLKFDTVVPEVETVHDDMDRDRFFTPEEAKEYGLIDHIIDRAS